MSCYQPINKKPRILCVFPFPKRPFMPKYGTVSQVLLKLVVANANFLSKELLKRIVLELKMCQ